MALATAGCDLFASECREGDTRCSGNNLEMCKLDDVSGAWRFGSFDDCSALGETCRQAGGGGSAACVSDVRCAMSSCDGQVAVLCHASGYVEWTTDCASQSGKVCTVGIKDAVCAYAAAPCPASGSSSFCDADGHRLWSGCDSGYAYASTMSDCAVDGGVCVSGNGTTECALAGPIPCDPGTTIALCSPDGTAIYFCGRSGFVNESSPCRTAGTTCKMLVSGGGSSTSCVKP